MFSFGQLCRRKIKVDKFNAGWLKGKPNFYFKYKRALLESMIEGSCINIGCGGHIIENAVNIDEGLPNLPYPDDSFDTVICSDVLEHLGPHKQAMRELLRIARKKVIVTVPAYKWLYARYDEILGHKRRYNAKDLTGFTVTYLFWFLVPVIFLRKLFNLRHRPLPKIIDALFLKLSRFNLGFGTTILALRYKVPLKTRMGHKISVFIPVFNEAKIIDRDIKTIEYVIRRIPFEYEIFVVNDASVDKTRLIAEKIAQVNKKVKLLNYRIGPTRRENLAQSFKEAGGDIIIFIDMDLVASLRFVPDLIDQIVLGYDIVTGSRYLASSQVKRKPFRLIISLFYNALIRCVFKTRIHDHMCGFKAFKRDVILKLVDEMGYDLTLKRGIFWDTELLIRAIRRGNTIKEIPIWWNERNKSALSFKRDISSAGYMFKFYKELKKQ